MQATNDKGVKLELGCLYEATKAGTKEAEFADGFKIKYLQDGDEIILRGNCGNRDSNSPSFGFGECSAVLLPAYEEER